MALETQFESNSRVTSRLSSTVERGRYDAKSVYVKRFTTNSGWESTPDSVQARCRRESEIISRLDEISGLGGRLGKVTLIECQPEKALLVTEEVAGKPLGEYLTDEYRQVGRRCLQALHLAGKWIRLFQSLSLHTGDNSHIGDKSPTELVAYCDIRLATLQSLGYHWVTNARRQQVLDAIDCLCKQASIEDSQFVWSHGDYAANNMLWDGKTLTTIDFAMANLNVPLLDVSYFIHRLQMLPIYFPWKRWPVDIWTRAFLRGYGRADAEQSDMYRALQIRHFLCRLQTYVRRPPKNAKQRLHNKWVRRCVLQRLMSKLSET